MLDQKAIVAVCSLSIALFVVFAVIAFAQRSTLPEEGIVGVSAKMECAFTWTLRAAGILIAVIAAVHLVRFAGQREYADHMVPGGVALLGGLLLLGQRDGVMVTAFGALVIGFIVQQLLIRRAPAQAVGSEPVAVNKAPPAQEAEATGIQVNRG